MKHLSTLALLAAVFMGVAGEANAVPAVVVAEPCAVEPTCTLPDCAPVTTCERRVRVCTPCGSVCCPPVLGFLQRNRSY